MLKNLLSSKTYQYDRARVLLITFFLFLILAIVAGAEEPAPAKAERRLAIVYVVDSSSSMSWIFRDVKTTLKDIVKASGPKMSIAIIMFGEKVTTLANYQSLNEKKKRFICDSIDAASPASLYTSFVPAAKRGIEYLFEDYRKDVAEKYLMVFITDGKDHPPPNYVKECSLEEALTQYADFLPGRDWTICYVALKEQIDPDFLALVRKYNGQFYNTSELSKILGVDEAKVVEDIIQDPERWEALEVSISDQFGNVEARMGAEAPWAPVSEDVRWKLAAGDGVAVGKDSTAVITIGSLAKIGLRENTGIELKRVDALPLKQQADIEIELEQGTIWSELKKKEGQPISYEVRTPVGSTRARGTAFRVSLDRDGREQTVSVFDGTVEVAPRTGNRFSKMLLEKVTQAVIPADKPPAPPSSIPDDILREWGKWKKIFSMQTKLLHTHFEPVKVTPLVESLTIGPIRPREKYTAQIPLQFSETYRGEEPLTAQPAIDLPEGALITTGVEAAGEDELLKNVSILIECEPFLRHVGKREIHGLVNLRCENPDVTLTRSSVELNILQAPPGLVQKFLGFSALEKALMAACALGACLAAATTGFYYKGKLIRSKNRLMSRMKDVLNRTKLVRLYRGRPVGQLIPDSGSSRAHRETFDLADISRKCDQVVLTIGRDAANSLCLSHSSLQPFHCLIYASRKRNPTDVYIEPRDDGKVSVNGEPVKGSRQLRNRDRIELANLRFQFVDVQSQRQVSVRMNDGERHTGILEYWDVGGMLFYMTEVLDKKEEFLTLDFRDVAYIEFYRDESDPGKSILPRQLRKPGKRKHVTVHLSNDIELHGIVDHKYRYREGNGIALLPRKKGKIQYIYVPWTSIKLVDAALEEEEEASG